MITNYATDVTVYEEILIFLMSIAVSGIAIGFSMCVLTVMIKFLLPKQKGAESDKEKNYKTNNNNPNTNRKDLISDIQEEETIVNAKPITDEQIEIDRLVDRVIDNMVGNSDDRR
jgi:hypothetical protein